MKSLIILPALCLLCGFSPIEFKENNVDNNVETHIAARQTKTTGVVHLVTKGCGIYIAVKDGDEIKRLYPVNLDMQYKKEGMKISFEYNLSRAMQPKDCAADLTVSVSNVKQL